MKARLLHPTEDFDWGPALQAAAAREAQRTGRHYRGENFDPQSSAWRKETFPALFRLLALQFFDRR